MRKFKETKEVYTLKNEFSGSKENMWKYDPMWAMYSIHRKVFSEYFWGAVRLRRDNSYNKDGRLIKFLDGEEFFEEILIE